MQLLRALRFERSSAIAFAGAGGKTTALFQLAHELDKPIIVTSTTHFGVWQIPLADKHIIAFTLDDLANKIFDDVTLITGPIIEDKTSPLDLHILNWLHAESKRLNIPLLIEADGSKQRPLKAPDEHEPAIPGFADIVVVVAGLNGLSKPLKEDNVQRPHLFSTLSGLSLNQPVTSDALVRVLAHSAGGLKNIPPHARKIILLNQADTPELQSIGGQMAKELLHYFDSVIVSTFKPFNPSTSSPVPAALTQAGQAFQTFEPIAGIILAAGESKRFGQPKQLLDWHGKPFIRKVAETALAAGLDLVIVVTGANADDVELAIKELPVQIVRNSEWQKGQSNSIKTGIKSLPEKTGAAIFLLADQPQIPVEVIRALIERHAKELNPIIAPLVLEERRANPVLFDRDTFQDLLTLEGDVGGRAIFDKHRVEYLPWHDDRLLLDVDKPEDYQRLIEDETL